MDVQGVDGSTQGCWSQHDTKVKRLKMSEELWLHGGNGLKQVEKSRLYHAQRLMCVCVSLNMKWIPATHKQDARRDQTGVKWKP